MPLQPFFDFFKDKTHMLLAKVFVNCKLLKYWIVDLRFDKVDTFKKCMGRLGKGLEMVKICFQLQIFIHTSAEIYSYCQPIPIKKMSSGGMDQGMYATKGAPAI